MGKKILNLFLWLFFYASLDANIIEIVAAENFYGDIASEIGGPYVKVTSILNNPNQDPHLFSTSADTARAIAKANLIIYNGINYDPWVKNLTKTDNNSTKTIIVVAELVNKREGDNPHIWYDPNTMLAFANKLTEELGKLDTEHKTYFKQQFFKFSEENKPFLNKIAEMKKRYQGTPVIATEPVFNYMAESLGLIMKGINFQLSVMNDTDISAQDIKKFEDNLRNHAVKVLIFNNQVINPITTTMKNIAESAGIPVVGVSETEPAGQSYIEWMMNQLNELDKSLGG